MDDKESINLMNEFLNDPNITDDEKQSKLKNIVLLFCDKQTDEKVISNRLKERCGDLMGISEQSLKLAEKIKIEYTYERDLRRRYEIQLNNPDEQIINDVRQPYGSSTVKKDFDKEMKQVYSDFYQAKELAKFE